ncbi:glutathione S-transferase N-terminal domain-containing protein [Ruegeria sp. AD91A]|uniref:glutathione S-transferase N-terminal domain-containing protein n=1 Tax=Ruegeria sp. AD91A TaxID=2293862 RepID=UPI0020C77B2D|nr:glutathione S-transferase N-terminal domain-containing protein [Ruegeria sp. AD91A]
MNRLNHGAAIMTENLTLVGHALCPYVQRIAIALAEKGVAYDRVTVDLADKPGRRLNLRAGNRTFHT